MLKQGNKLFIKTEDSKMTPTNFPDSQKISLKVIEAIREHPVLYIAEAKCDGALKLQEFRQKVWKRISDELGLDSGWVKLKWKNLRDTYSRLVKWRYKSPVTLKRKKWIFEDELSFLKFPYEPDYEEQYVQLSDEYINDINAEVVTSQDLINQLDDNDVDDYNDYLEILEGEINAEQMEFEEVVKKKTYNYDKQMFQEVQDQITINAVAQQIQSKFRKIRPKSEQVQEKTNQIIVAPVAKSFPAAKRKAVSQTDQSMKKVQRLQSDKTSYDHKSSIDEFFKSIAQTVKKLPPKAQADIKLDICKIVSEAEIRHLQENGVPSMQKYTNMPGMIPKLVLVPCKIIDDQM